MGRRRQKTNAATDNDTSKAGGDGNKPRKGLAPAWTGVKDPIGLHFHHEGELISFHKFGQLYSAKKFIEAVIEEYDTSWVDERSMKVRRGWITITAQQGPTLEDIMEHEYTPAEREWTLPVPYPGYARQIRNFWEGSQIRREKLTGGSKTDTGGITTEREPDRKPRSEVKREKRSTTPREKRPDGLASIGDIAESIDMDPREARALLRSAKTPKPAHGWAWPKGEVDGIKKTLESGRKKK